MKKYIICLIIVTILLISGCSFINETNATIEPIILPNIADGISS